MFVLSKSDLNEALRHYPEAQELLNRKAKQLMKQNAEMEERKDKALIVIANPSKPDAQPKLLDAVMQAVPEHSKVNNLLRYGSKGKPSGGRRKSTSSNRGQGQFQAKVTVHRCSS